MKNITKVTVTAAALALALAGCSIGPEPAPETVTVTETASAGPSTSKPSPSSESSSSSTTEAPSASTEQAGPKVAAFGKTFTYADGLEVKVSKPGPFTPSQTAAGIENHTSFITFDVTVTNGTDKVYDPAMNLMLDVTSGSGGTSQVFDVGHELSPVMNAAKVLPGTSTTMTVAYGVNDPQDVGVQVTPGFKYETAFFGGHK